MLLLRRPSESAFAHRLVRSCATTVVHSFDRRRGSKLVLQVPNAATESQLRQEIRCVQAAAQGINAQGSADGTGFSVWNSARLLSEHLVALADSGSLPPGPHVELGSGLGLCSLTLAKILSEDGSSSLGATAAVDSPAAAAAAAATTRDIVYCTDGDSDVLSLVQATAELNGVGHHIRTAPFEWSSQSQLSWLLSELEQLGLPPGLVFGSDVCYNLTCIPMLLDTIAALQARLTLLAFPPRHTRWAEFLSSMCRAATGTHLDKRFAACREVELLEYHAARHGLRVERIWRHGNQQWAGQQLVVALLQEHDHRSVQRL